MSLPPASCLIPFLDAQGVVILDGGLGTELERQGATLDPKLWSAGTVIDSPHILKAVHMSYLEAGADVIITASYQASVRGFMEKGYSCEEAETLLRRTVEVAIEARDEFWQTCTTIATTAISSGPTEASSRKRCRPLVAASVGCYGASCADGSEYRGQYGLTMEELKEWHAPRLKVLAQCGADILALETLPCEVEVRALLSLLEEDDHLRTLPTWISFACRDSLHLNSGDSLESCARLVRSSSAAILSMGVNCTKPLYVYGALEVLRSSLAPSSQQSSSSSSSMLLLLHAYPNTGEAYEGKQWVGGSGTGDQALADMAVRWVDQLGASLVGGCCRTTPDTIRVLSKVLIDDRRL